MNVASDPYRGDQSGTSRVPYLRKREGGVRGGWVCSSSLLGLDLRIR